MAGLRNFVAALAVLCGLGLALAVGPANAADESVWLCKPGQADNPCLGKMDGNATLPDGSQRTLGYAAAENPPVDCFYLYPTQSEQPTDNANLNPDQELKDVAVNQARQFSRVCDVYAPLYRQYTLAGLSHVTPEMRDIAYADVLKAWQDYLENYNDGRGVILLGHSQGSSHLSRLVSEEIDGDAAVRDKIISAILPGANVYVPKGAKVGGQFKNIPACEAGSQIGCVIAYSMYLNEPESSSRFGRVATGYWVNPAPRPDPAQYEVLCVNPSELSGNQGIMQPLANLDAFLGHPESAKPWMSMPDFYRAECKKSEDANWLNVADIRDPGDSRTDLTSLIASSEGDLHLGDVNLALDDLVNIAQSETGTYLKREASRAAVIKKAAASKRLTAAKKKLKAKRTQVGKLNRKLRKAKKACRAAKKAGRRVKARCKPQKKLTRQVKTTKRQAAATAKQVKAINAEIAALNEQIDG